MEMLMADKSVHDLELELVKFQTQQDHLVDSVDKLKDDMKEVKVTLFQAKWMIVGALLVAGLMNSDMLMEAIIGFSK
jgi:hypothetical protein